MSAINQNIQALLDAHPRDCIFLTDAVDVISKRAKSLASEGMHGGLALIEAFSEAELYCPHEVVNRLPHN